MNFHFGGGKIIVTGRRESRRENMGRLPKMASAIEEFGILCVHDCIHLFHSNNIFDFFLAFFLWGFMGETEIFRRDGREIGTRIASRRPGAQLEPAFIAASGTRCGHSQGNGTARKAAAHC